MEFYRKAAEQGCPRPVNLAVCCLNGIGMEADAPQGVEWLERAAAQDFARAQCILADCCKTGSGLARTSPGPWRSMRRPPGRGIPRPVQSGPLL